VIEVEGVSKRYGDVAALNQVSFTAKSGRVLGLLGPNGAGKSTLMRILSGYLRPTAGKARVAGCDVETQSMEGRRLLGYLPENPGLYLEQRVTEYLSYRAALKGVRRHEFSRALDRALERCGLGDVRRRIIGQLSKGFRQRVSLAAALIHDPPVLILDEPTVGLDPNQIREIRRLVRELGRNRTVLFSTHILPEAEAVCDRVVIIDRGNILADATPDELASRFRSQALRVEIEGDLESSIAALRHVDGLDIELLQAAPTVRLRIRAAGASEPGLRAAISRALTRSGAVLLELSLEGTSLDEIFARLTHEGGSDA